MSSTAAAIAVIAFFVFSVGAAYLLIRRAMRHEARHSQVIRDLREKAETAREIDELELAYEMPAYDPAWAAGMERLWDAIRDEQQKEAGDA